MRPGPQRANRKKGTPGLLKGGAFLRITRLEQNVSAAEFTLRVFVDVAPLLDAVAAGEDRGLLGSERGHQLSVGPYIERTFALLVRMGRIGGAIGVLGRI